MESTQKDRVMKSCWNLTVAGIHQCSCCIWGSFFYPQFEKSPQSTPWNAYHFRKIPAYIVLDLTLTTFDLLLNNSFPTYIHREQKSASICRLWPSLFFSHAAAFRLWSQWEEQTQVHGPVHVSASWNDRHGGRGKDLIFLKVSSAISVFFGYEGKKNKIKAHRSHSFSMFSKLWLKPK